MHITKIEDENLDFIFNPKTVAVIGASSSKGKWGNEIMHNLLEAGFAGDIYPVNPKGGYIFNLKAYKSVKEIDSSVDLAIIGIPANSVLSAVKDCAGILVKGVVIVSAGFGEMVVEGRELQRQILDVAKKSGMRIVGQNCLGP